MTADGPAEGLPDDVTWDGSPPIPPELPPEDLEPEPLARPLSGFLSAIREPALSPSEAGGVPLPEAWRCVRAALGGATREELERAHAPESHGRREDDARHADLRVTRAEAEGSHLAAGLHIVTGQTGGGKSALVTNLALAAATGGHPVLYLSLELDGEEVAARVLGLESGLPWFKLAQRKPLSEEETRTRDAAVAALEAAGVPERFRVHAPLAGLDVAAVAGLALALWEETGRVPLVVLDYLQLATVRTTPGQYQPQLREAVASVVLALRLLSRKREDVPGWPGCPVVVLSTTARANVKGEGAVRGLTGEDPDALRWDDLETLKALPKEAGEIEATAVTAWVVALGEKAENGRRPLTLRLVKYRGGMPGQWVPFAFDGATGRLEEAPTRYAEARVADREAAQERGEKKAKNGRGKAPTSAVVPAIPDDATDY